MHARMQLRMHADSVVQVASPCTLWFMTQSGTCAAVAAVRMASRSATLRDESSARAVACKYGSASRQIGKGQACKIQCVCDLGNLSGTAHQAGAWQHASGMSVEGAVLWCASVCSAAGSTSHGTCWHCTFGVCTWIRRSPCGLPVRAWRPGVLAQHVLQAPALQRPRPLPAPATMPRLEYSKANYVRSHTFR